MAQRDCGLQALGTERTSAAAAPYPQDTQTAKCLFGVLSSHLCDPASPREMTGAALPGLGENSCQDQHLLGMQRGDPRDPQGNQGRQLGLEGHPGTPVPPECWMLFLEGFVKIQSNYCIS